MVGINSNIDDTNLMIYALHNRTRRWERDADSLHYLNVAADECQLTNHYCVLIALWTCHQFPNVLLLIPRGLGAQ